MADDSTDTAAATAALLVEQCRSCAGDPGAEHNGNSASPDCLIPTIAAWVRAHESAGTCTGDDGCACEPQCQFCYATHDPEHCDQWGGRS